MKVVNGDLYDLRSLLSSEERDFLVRHNGDQVKIGELDGKMVGLYFSEHWCRPCRRFTPKLAGVYKELSTNGGLEVVFVSADTDEESFKEYFGSMPWLAVPFSDSTVRENLKDLFKVQRIPRLVILNGNRKLLTKDGVRVIGDYGAEGYPFTTGRMEELAARKAQNLASILVSGERDFVISNDGKNVPISELEGKIVGLYFSVNSSPPCRNFTNNLIRVYQELKDKGASFEVVLISLDSDENSFKEQFQAMPWFALPFNDKACAKLPRYFELNSPPTLVIIGTDGKTLNPNVAKLIENHGINAYPFSPEKLAELTELEKRRPVSRTLESLLVTSERDFVIGGGGVKIPVSKLVGKTILLYFPTEWCGPCRAFLPKLIQAYNEIKAKGEAFEVIFISSDSDQESFGKFFSEMPWLALPYGDATMKSLRRTFKIKGIPTLVAIGPDGRTVTTEAWKLLTVHGSDAYPFTEHRLKELEALQEEEKKKKANEEEEEKKKNANEEDGEKKNAKEHEENKNANEEDGEKKNDNEDEEQKKANEEDGKHGDHEQDGQKEGYMRVKLVLKLNFPMFFFLALLERRWGNVV